MTEENRSTMQEPYFQVPNDVFELNIPSREKLVLIYLYRLGNQGSEIFPSYKTIVARCGITKPTAVSAVKGLEEKNLIKVTRRRKSNKDNYSNIYQLPGKIILPGPSKKDLPPGKNSLPNKELLNKELHPYKEQIQGFPSEKTSENYTLSFEEFKTQNHIQEEDADIINYFLWKYKLEREEDHPPLTPEKWQEQVNLLRVIEKDGWDVDGADCLLVEDFERMIDKYFATNFENCNYRLPHFNQPAVKYCRFYEEVY